MQLEQGRMYKFCTCGLSQTDPFCDGAHKGTKYKSLKFVYEKKDRM